MPQAKKEIYGKSTQGTYNVEKYIQRVTTLSLTLRVYIYSFSSCCLSNCKILRNFETKIIQGHRSWCQST